MARLVTLTNLGTPPGFGQGVEKAIYWGAMARKLGRYELLRPLGRGGMAEVFLARRRGPGGVEKRLVVKRIRRERAKDPRFVSMFVREAQVSMSLAHKNIVPMFDFGRAGSELFLVMEYIKGLDLGAALESAKARDRVLDPLLSSFIAIEACQALDYAHGMVDEAGEAEPVVHRDITPRNVLLSVAGEVKLVDFGLATTEVESSGGKIRGTPMYMSPEQARGEQVDGRSDLFALGLILWEALAGRRAYDQRDPAKILALARQAEVPALPHEVPEELREIVARATRRDPDDRFQTARDMQMALDGYVVTARAQSSGDRARPLGHWLAESVQEALDQSPELGPETELEQMPSGDVVTFLDDGELGLAKITTTNATIRSLAETVAGDEDGEPDSEPDGEPNRDPHGNTDAESQEYPAVLPFMETAPASSEQASASQVESAPELDDPRRPGRRGIMWLSAAAIGAAIVIATVWRIESTNSEPRNASKSDVERATLATGNEGTATMSPPVAGRDASVAGAGMTVSSPGKVQDNPGETGQQSPLDPPDRGSSSDQNDSPRPGPKRNSEREPQAGQKTGQKTEPATARKPDRKTGRKTDQEQDNAPGTLGSVRVSTSPWAKVSVAGRAESCRDTPCKLDLPPGTYSLKLHNPVKNVGKTVTVDIKAGETATIREILTRAP